MVDGGGVAHVLAGYFAQALRFTHSSSYSKQIESEREELRREVLKKSVFDS
jgi:hypothetical protein